MSAKTNHPAGTNGRAVEIIDNTTEYTITSPAIPAPTEISVGRKVVERQAAPMPINADPVNDLHAFGRQCRRWGAAVTAIRPSTKQPSHKWSHWQTQKQKDDEFERLPWSSAAALGVVNGAGDWRVFDLDAVKDDDGRPVAPVPDDVVVEMLKALGLPDDYQWSYVSGSGAGFGVVIRCTESLPAGWKSTKGIYIGSPREGRVFGQLELRWSSGQTVIGGAHPIGPGYRWRLGERPFVAPALLTAERVIAGFAAIAAMDMPTELTPVASPPPRTAKGAGYGAAALADAVDKVSRAANGTRNDTLFREAAGLAELVNGGALDRPEVERQLTAAALAAGLPEAESRATIASAFNHVGDRARQLPTGGLDRPTRNGHTGQGCAHAAFPANPHEGSTAPVRLDERLPLVDLDLLHDCYEREEVGDGRLFAFLYGRRVAYDHSEAAWYLWDGNHFRRDHTGQIKLLYSVQVAAKYLEGAAALTLTAGEATAAGNKAEADACGILAQGYIQRARQLQKKYRASNALDFATSLLGVTGDVWDNCPGLLPVANGVVDLTTGELRGGQPEDRVRTHALHAWQGLEQPCPRWEQFISEIMGGREAMAQFLWRLLGYGIGGLATEHKFPILWGQAGRNGKDTLVETLGYVLGPLACSVTKDVVIDPGGRNYGGAPTPHLMDLRGKRLVWASEPREGARLDAAQVKLITGGGRLKGRGVYERVMVEWQPTHLAMLITNPRPHAPADDLALWERILLIPFTQRFVDNPQGADEHPVDKELRLKLQGEASGILAWLVRGHLAWRREGLNPPADVRVATAAYQQAEDTLSQFLDDTCLYKDGASVRAKDLYTLYSEWCLDGGLKPMSARGFGEKMKKRLSCGRDRMGITYLGIATHDAGRHV